jgi:hypothetical protein
MNNTATSDYALYSNMTGAQNTAIGANALILNITGKNNTGIGYQAFVHNTVVSTLLSATEQAENSRPESTILTLEIVV